MRLRHRLRRAEDKAGLKNHGPIPIIWDGRMEDEWKRRAELAEKRGCGLSGASASAGTSRRSTRRSTRTAIRPASA